MSSDRSAVAGRSVLLDTCALLDLISRPERIASEIETGLADLSTRLLVSAVSAWEVAIKTRRGKLVGGDRLVASWEQSLLDLRAEPLVIDFEDAIRAGGLRWDHRDPFDRMLVAQAIRYNLPLVTSDRTILDAGVVTVIDTTG